MATKTAAPKRINKYLAKIGVNFKNLSVGDATATVGFSITRERCNVDAAEGLFCGKRLTVCIMLGAGDPDQKLMFEDAQYRVDGIADAKKFSVTPKLITSALCFPLDGLNIEELTHFAKKEGVLVVVKASEAAQEDDGDEEEDEDDEETRDGTDDE